MDDKRRDTYGGEVEIVMRDHEEVDGTPEPHLMGELVYDGKREAVTVEQFADYIEKHSLPSEVATMEVLGAGIIRWTFHPEKIENAEYGDVQQDEPLRVFIGGTAFMRTDIPYFSLLFDGEKVSDGLLYACTEDAVQGEQVTSRQIALMHPDKNNPGREVRMTNDNLEFIEQLDNGAEAYHKPPEAGLDLDNLFEFYAESGTWADSDHLTVSTALFALLTIQTGIGIAMEHERRIREQREREAAERGVSISSPALDKVNFTTDKANSKVWNRWATLAPGQLAMGFREDGSADIDIDMANIGDRERGIARPLIYAISFNELEETGIAPHLDPYDRRVYEALSSLWNNITTRTAQEVFSLKDIYHAMGYTGNPGAKDKARITDSLTKMMKAHISIDSIGEAEAYNYPHFKYDASLLPAERLTGYVDGQPTDSILHLFREPPLFTFARERNQITTYSIKLLQSPLSKTDTNLLIDDYLREQIAWMKRPAGKGKASKRSNKITLEAIYSAAGITRRDARIRKRKDIVKLLEHYKECGWIKGFTDTGDGFEITY